MKTSPTLKNISRPAAFIKVKHTITSAENVFDLRQARKMIDRYIENVCEKSLRETHKLDLLYILEWKCEQMQTDGYKFEDPIDAMLHKKLEAK